METIEEKIKSLQKENELLKSLLEEKKENLFIKRIELSLLLLEKGNLGDTEKGIITNSLLEQLGYNKYESESK